MSPLPHEVLIALGSNLGDREKHIRDAARTLQESGAVTEMVLSNLHETQPVGGPRQGPFLNAVLRGRTRFDAHVLLETMLTIEKEHGRKRREPDGPRTLDLDIVFYGDQTIDSMGLNIPHPRCHERLFVLEPAAEIAPDWVHPLLNMTVRDLRDQQIRRQERSEKSGSQGLEDLAQGGELGS